MEHYRDQRAVEYWIDPRGSFDKYFMDLTKMVATRSTCTRRQVGAIAVKDKRILATGYNGVPSGLEHCAKIGCLREQMKIPSGERHEICRAVHAEQNVIIQAAIHGISLKDSEIYCTHTPCFICTKMLISVGIRKIYYLDSYPDNLSLEMLSDAQVKLEDLSYLYRKIEETRPKQ